MPVTRDYSKLEAHNVGEAAALVDEARRLGAPYHAPYAFYSATYYLAMARSAAASDDRLGTWDYAEQASNNAKAAIQACSEGQAMGAPAAPRGRRSCEEALARLKRQWAELDREKAIAVSPVVYAHLTAELSRAEHVLMGGGPWRDAAEALGHVQDGFNTIMAQDTDGDAASDLEDAAPWAPEDVDGFEDLDGAPDADNDRDGVPDVVDAAPLEPETKNRWRDADGAPDVYPVLDVIDFEPDCIEPPAEAKGYLRGLALLFEPYPDLVLRVSGHAVGKDTDEADLDLSRRRAQEVQRRLRAYGVPDAQLVVTYHGNTQPVTDRAGVHEDCVALTFE